MKKVKFPLLAMLITSLAALFLAGYYIPNIAAAGSYVRPYGADAPWNRPVRDANGEQLISVHPQSDTYRHRHWLYSPNIDGSKPGNFNVNPGYSGYTYPVYDASTATGDYQVTTGYRWANMNNRYMPWNPNWIQAGGSDGQVIVLDPQTGREWNLWQVEFVNNKISATNANLVLSQVNNVSEGTDPYPYAGDYFTKENGFSPSRGCGIQYLAMLVRPEEIRDGIIRHALSVPVANPSKTFYVAPATKLERTGSDTGKEIPEGMRFALNVTDQQIETWLNSLPSDLPNRAATISTARIVAKALRDYGWFITDTSGGAHFQFEDYHTAGDDWVELGLGYNTTDGTFTSGNGKTYPQDLLDGLLAENRIYTLVSSDQYPEGNTVSLNPTADSYVDGGNAAANYGTSTALKIKDGDGTAYDRISYFKFNLNSVSGGIASARLKVYCSALSNGVPSAAKTFRVSSDSWTETGVTWNNKPALGAQEGSQVSFGAIGWYEFDVTDYVSAEMSGDKTVTIALSDNTLVNKMIDLSSRETSNKPVLEIETTSAAPTPTPTPTPTPRTTNLNPEADSYVDGGSASANYGSVDTLIVKDGSGTGYDRISYLKFNLGSLSGSVSSAKLKVYCNALPNGTPSAAKAFRVTGDGWTETGITWNNKPALGAQEGSQLSFGATGWYEFDVTGYVSVEYGGDKTVTIALSDNTQVNKMIEMDSREGANKPVLVVVTD